jgi:hypothetical protein
MPRDLGGLLGGVEKRRRNDADQHADEQVARAAFDLVMVEGLLDEVGHGDLRCASGQMRLNEAAARRASMVATCVDEGAKRSVAVLISETGPRISRRRSVAPTNDARKPKPIHGHGPALTAGVFHAPNRLRPRGNSPDTEAGTDRSLLPPDRPRTAPPEVRRPSDYAESSVPASSALTISEIEKRSGSRRPDALTCFMSLLSSVMM